MFHLLPAAPEHPGGSSSHAIPNFQDRLSSQPTPCSKTWKPCPSLNVAAKNKEEGVDSHPKSCLLLVLQKLDSLEAGHEGCQGDLKYRFVTILNKSAPRAQRGEGVRHSKSSVAQILKWGNKQKKKEQRKVWLRDVQAGELRHAGSSARNATGGSYSLDRARTSGMLVVQKSVFLLSV